MADGVIEESEYIPGKDELDWGYQEGERAGCGGTWKVGWMCVCVCVGGGYCCENPWYILYSTVWPYLNEWFHYCMLPSYRYLGYKTG